MVPSGCAVKPRSGLYLYDATVFDIIRDIGPSLRGELEISEVNNRYIALGQLASECISGYWADCGASIDALFEASQLVAARGANND